MPNLDFNLLPINTPKMLESIEAHRNYLKFADRYILSVFTLPDGIVSLVEARGFIRHTLDRSDRIQTGDKC